MKNAATYLYFKSLMGKLPDAEKFWLTNHMVYAFNHEGAKTDLDRRLEFLLKQPIAVQNTVEWWQCLRQVSEAPMFYKILRQR